MTTEGMTPPAAPSKPHPRRRRRVVVAALAIIVIVLGTLWARFAPLVTGSSWNWPVASADAWQLDHAFLDDRTTVIARNEPGATLTFELTIRNESRLAIRILDQESTVTAWQEHALYCGWQPQEVRFSPPSWYDDYPGTLEPPFTVPAGEEVTVEFVGAIGQPDDPCTMHGLSWQEIDASLRYSVFGIPRTQQFPLDLTVGITDFPEDWLEMEVLPLSSD